MGLGAKLKRQPYEPPDAFRRQRYPGEVVLDCPQCGAKMRLRESKHGLFYGCENYPRCDATHGAHKDSGEPLGTPADKRTKWWRMRAHDAFDLIWKEKKHKRNPLYGKMASFLRLSREDCHIGRFDVDMCQRSIQFSNNLRTIYGLPIYDLPKEPDWS